ncbi:MAG: hypothetical protein IPF92_11570 [Myxococcales bacterium]|nr:hypothetical protein [Myxococcales bacterium]MBL0198284.1 hypothetical protein [Myxococcales bacterium]
MRPRRPWRATLTIVAIVAWLGAACGAPEAPIAATSPASLPTAARDAGVALDAGSALEAGAVDAWAGDGGDPNAGVVANVDAGGAVSTSTPPPTLTPPHARTAQPDDGAWRPLRSDSGEAVLYETTLHPSATNPYVSVSLVAADLTHVALRLVAGTREPVAPDVPASARAGLVPAADHAGLLAVANGGWRSEHGRFAMRVGPHRFDRPRPGRGEACTVGLDEGGRLVVGPWAELEPRETELAAWRQTPACLVLHGAVHPALATETHTRRWGAAADGGVEIPRTALGVDRAGRYALFALGDRTTAKALADTMVAAGARAAAELDINWSYTRFFLYSNASGAPRIARSIGTKGQHPATSYVERRSERDFFYFARRAP